MKEGHGMSVLRRGDSRGISLCKVRAHEEGSRVPAWKRVPKVSTSWHLDLQLDSLHDCEKHICVAEASQLSKTVYV